MKSQNKIALPDYELKDLGLGTKVSSQGKRMVNKDGSFNVERRSMPFFESLSIYHSLLSMSWWKFNGVVIAAYVAVNLFFASLYMIIGVDHLGGITGTTTFEKFLDAFFFSGQTITTVGYGVIHPVGFWASLISLIESMAGLLGFALATGLLYGRFSKPNAKIKYSNNAVIAPYRGITAFEFRIANARKNQLIDVEVLVTASMKEGGESGVRKFYTLDLERKQINFFPLSWTVVHPINETSPLLGITYNDLVKSDAEFIILIKAFDDAFSQSVHSRTSYTYHEIIWGAKFRNLYVESERNVTAIDMNKFHGVEAVEL